MKLEYWHDDEYTYVDIRTASANYRKLFKEIDRLRSENEAWEILHKLLFQVLYRNEEQGDV